MNAREDKSTAPLLALRVHSCRFSYLEIATNASNNDNDQAYAAGILEGYLTRELISIHFNNTMRGYCEGQEEYCSKLNYTLTRDLDHIQDNIWKRDQDPHWHQVRLLADDDG